MIGALQRYLDGLEATLESLAQTRRSLATVMQRIGQLDAVYDRCIHRPLNASAAYLKYRYYLQPFFEPTAGIIGVADAELTLSTAQMAAVIESIMSQFSWTPSNLRASRGVPQLLCEFGLAMKTRRRSEIAASYNRLLTHQQVLPIWSAKLAEVRPSANQFRELAFRYS
jgi:hypothetical protein